jgi:hypothetical protein
MLAVILAPTAAWSPRPLLSLDPRALATVAPMLPRDASRHLFAPVMAEAAADDEGWVSSFAQPDGMDCTDEDECVLPELDEGGEGADTDHPGERWSTADLERLSSVELAKVRQNKKDPPNPADALRAAGEGGRVLDEMELACCWLQYEGPSDALPLPRFRVTARPSRILEPELRQMACVLRAALDRGEQFTIMWDLRRLVPPSISALDYGAKWQSDNAADIERLGQSITVLVSSPVTRICANLCTKVCNPPQPVRICKDEEQATAFARGVLEQQS